MFSLGHEVSPEVQRCALTLIGVSKLPIVCVRPEMDCHIFHSVPLPCAAWDRIPPTTLSRKRNNNNEALLNPLEEFSSCLSLLALHDTEAHM